MGNIHRSTWIAVALILALALLFARDLGHTILAQSNATATPNVNWVDTRAGINIRSGPGYNYDPIGGLALGAWVQPIARNSDGQWILIAYGSSQGWIQRDGVYWRLNTAALPLVDGQDFTPIPADALSTGPGSPTYTPNANWVNVGLNRAYVRSGPGQGWLPVGQAMTGQVVEPVARDESGDWVLIFYGNGYGWISRDLVLWINDTNALPVYNDTNLTPAFTMAPTLALVTNTPTLGITRTVPPTVAATITRAPTELASPTIVVSRTPTSILPSTSTPRPTVTDTTVPPTVPTDTSVPPTSPPTVVPPTDTQAPTNTPVPPTAAPTSTPAPTNTRVPATPVPTEPPAEPTSTPRPPTNTAIPATATPRPANTAVLPTVLPATEIPASATPVVPPLLILPANS